MRLSLGILACVCVLTGAVGSLAQSSAANEVMRLERKAWKLWQQGDKQGFAALMDRSFVAVDTHGIAGKEDNVQEISNLIKERYELSDFQSHSVDENVIFVTYRAKLEGTYKGKRIDGKYNVSSVWAKRGDQWLNVLYHETRAE